MAEVSSYSRSTPVYTTVNQATYDTHGRILTATDALGRRTTTAYTPASNGLLTQMSLTGPDPDGSGPLTAHVTQTTFDPARGTQTKIVDPNAKITSGTYDALGRMTQVWLPGRVQGTDTPNMKYSYSVSASGTNAVSTDTLIHNGTYSTSTTLYDGLLRPRQTQSPAKNRDTNDRVVTDTIYDSRGLLVRENGPWATAGAPSTTLVAPASQETLPARTLTEYDGAGRVTNEIFQVNEAERWRTVTSYNGNRTSIDPPPGAIPTTTVTDARGNTTELLSYIGAGPSGTANTTRYTYDSAGRVASMTDPAGNVWTHTYDLRGREIAATDPDTGASTFTYDNADQRISSTDARGITLVTQYDQLGRKTHLRESSATGTVRATWAWDTLAKGQQTSSARIDAGNTYTSAVTGYDNGYRPLGQTTTIPASEGALAGAYTTSYTYTLDGLPLSVKYPSAGGLSSETVTTRYDSRSMPEWMGGGLGFGIYVAQSEYTPYGETAMVDLGSLYSQLVTFNYEMGTRRTETTSLQREGASGRELDINYSYDEAGNVTRIADAPTAKPADVQCFAYDNQSRLSQAWTPSSGNCAATRSVTGLGGPAPYWNSYTHNTAGNRTATTTRTPTATRTASSTYPAATAARPHAVTSISTTGTGGTTSNSFTYDNAGNTLTRAIAGQPTQTLTWDAEGRLDTLTQSTVSHDYIYGADGERLLRNQAGVKTVYLPGGQELALSAGTVKATRYYGFGGTTVAVRTGTGSANTSAVISDHHDTAELIVNNSSNVVTRRYHDPYGVPRGTAPAAWAGDHGFLGKPTDTTGLTHIGARFYDSAQGRFISPDPLLDREQPQQWAAYTYGNGNPTTLSDPTGLAPTLNQHDGRGRQSNINRPQRQTSNYGRQLGLTTVQPPVSIRRPPAPAVQVKAKAPASAPKPAAKEKPKQQNAFSRWGHAILDGAGLIPGVGEIADGVNAIWYAAEGDWGNAALSAAAMIPVAGAAVTAGKWTARGTNAFVTLRANANAVQATGKPTGASGALWVQGRKSPYFGVSGNPGNMNSRVQAALDSVPANKRPGFHGQCAEVSCLNQALGDGFDPAGGTSVVVAIGNTRPGHGQLMAPCSSCRIVLDSFGVNY